MLLLPLMEDTAQLKNKSCMQELQIFGTGAHYLHATSPTHTARSSDFPPEFPDEKNRYTPYSLVRQKTLKS